MSIYQLLPDLTPEEYAALKADIAMRGVQVPIEFDEKGEVLDGHHRLKACQELGRDYSSITRVGLSEDEKTAHILSLNLNRRHLTREQRQELHAKLRELGWSLRQIAEATQVDAKTVRNDLAGGEKSPPARTNGRDGKSYPARRPSVMAKNRREAARAFKALEILPADALPNTVLDVKRVERLEREYQAANRRKAQTESEAYIGTAHLLLGDFRERSQEISAASVDLIFTDPPYHEQYLPLWRDLSEFAARVLKPGGMLVAYTGALYLLEVMASLSEHLRYWWMGAIVLNGSHSRMHARNVVQGSKPLLFFVRHDFVKPAEWFEDVYFSEAEQKDIHDWQQSLGAAKYYIGQLTCPGARVVDPFLGGGTTGLAALQTGRNFLGIEIDPAAFASSEERLRIWTNASAT